MISKPAIDAAIAAHGQWRKRLEEAIASGKSELNAVEVGRDDACELGRWLRSLPLPDRSPIHYEKVLRLHAEFHATAAEILGLAVTRAQQEAAKRMEFGNDYTLASGRLILALHEWKNNIKPAPPT
jgi:hypothetical protein